MRAWVEGVVCGRSCRGRMSLVFRLLGEESILTLTNALTSLACPCRGRRVLSSPLNFLDFDLVA